MFAAGAAAAALAAACRGTRVSDEGPGASPGPSASPAASADEALSRGIRWLAPRYEKDGTWRSEVYGAFKDGWSLTPLATIALLRAGAIAEAQPGIFFLVGAARAGAIDWTRNGRMSPAYPAYTAALALAAVSHPSASSPSARKAWQNELRSRQLTESLGWTNADAHYGGWGYATAIPRKPAPGAGLSDAFLESNLSATSFALDALAAAGAPSSDPAFQSALIFVERQQNFAPQASPVDDGGFFFMPEDEVRNKAGLVDPAAKPRRFHSYGSMTANGLRSLLRCGLPQTHPRVVAAREWLLTRFDATRHPGTYRAEREEVRDSVWFYWSASVAAAFALAEVPRERWAAPLVRELLRRQRADGSWASDLVAVREDDPVVATSFALLALAAASRGVF